jgi:hypothetical protein
MPIYNPQWAKLLPWAGVIAIWAMILWVPELLLFGKELFTKETPIIDDSTLLTTLYFILAGIEVILGVWAIVVFLKCLGEVQGFSAWKALGNYLLLCLVIIVPILGVVGLIWFLVSWI